MEIPAIRVLLGLILAAAAAAGCTAARMPRCAVGGVLHGGRAMCGDVITGGEFCGHAGECRHKVVAP